MEKLSRRWRCRLVSACGTRLINNRLSETCAHHCLSGQNLRNVQASPKKKKRAISSNYSRAHSGASSSGAKLLNRGGFLNCPHSVQHQPGRGRSWRELKVTHCKASAKKGRDARYAAKKAHLFFTPTLQTLEYARWVQTIRSKGGCEDFAFFLGLNLKGATPYKAR